MRFALPTSIILLASGCAFTPVIASEPIEWVDRTMFCSLVVRDEGPEIKKFVSPALPVRSADEFREIRTRFNQATAGRPGRVICNLYRSGDDTRMKVAGFSGAAMGSTQFIHAFPIEGLPDKWWLGGADRAKDDPASVASSNAAASTKPISGNPQTASAPPVDYETAVQLNARMRSHIEAARARNQANADKYSAAVASNEAAKAQYTQKLAEIAAQRESDMAHYNARVAACKAGHRAACAQTSSIEDPAAREKEEKPAKAMPVRAEAAAPPAQRVPIDIGLTEAEVRTRVGELRALQVLDRNAAAAGAAQLRDDVLTTIANGYSNDPAALAKAAMTTVYDQIGSSGD